MRGVIMPLIFGTWKLDPRYGKIDSIKDALEIIDYAVDRGINHFDTASVYANQEIEKILGRYSEKKIDIISKIPATKKVPYLEKYNALDLYPLEWLERYVSQTTNNLRTTDYTMLLHNYGYWDNIDEVLLQLYKYKERRIVSNIGISIPNNFSGIIPSEILDIIDTLEIPYNVENRWIESNLEKLEGKRVLLRSLLKDLKNGDIDEKKVRDIILKGGQYSDDLIIGMTNPEQVDINLKVYEDLYKWGNL